MMECKKALDILEREREALIKEMNRGVEQNLSITRTVELIAAMTTGIYLARVENNRMEYMAKKKAEQEEVKA